MRPRWLSRAAVCALPTVPTVSADGRDGRCVQCVSRFPRAERAVRAARTPRDRRRCSDNLGSGRLAGGQRSPRRGARVLRMCRRPCAARRGWSRRPVRCRLARLAVFSFPLPPNGCHSSRRDSPRGCLLLWRSSCSRRMKGVDASPLTYTGPRRKDGTPDRRFKAGREWARRHAAM